jgi:hypothetical protein
MTESRPETLRMVGPWRGHLGLVFHSCEQGRDALATKEAMANPCLRGGDVIPAKAGRVPKRDVSCLGSPIRLTMPPTIVMA